MEDWQKTFSTKDNGNKDRMLSANELEPLLSSLK